MIDFTEQEVTADAIDVAEKLYDLLVQELSAPTQRSLTVAVQGLAMAAGVVIAQAMENARNPLKLRRLMIDFLVAHTKKIASLPSETVTKH